MKLVDLNKDQAIQVLAKVEKALQTKSTKSTVVAALAQQGLCSPKSTGIESTLLKVAQKYEFVPSAFAALMKVKPQQNGVKSHPWIDKKGGDQPQAKPEEGLPPVPQIQTSKAGLAQKPERRLGTTAFAMSGLNLRAVSVLELGPNGQSTAHLRDGRVVPNCSISEEVLKKNCKVIELGD